jgi:hypothetical protein
MPIRENITEKSMSSSRSPRIIFVGNSLLLQSRREVDPWFSSRFRFITSLPRLFRKSICAWVTREKKKIDGRKALL